MKGQHTPGPWATQPTAGHDAHGQSAVYAEADGKDIAVVYDGEANARLIAAAPELVAALRLAVEELLEAAHTMSEMGFASQASENCQQRATEARALLSRVAGEEVGK